MAEAAAEFDYVVIGAGTAGSVLANRLSEDPAVSVLVLEAGGSAIPGNVDTAPLWFTLLGSPVDWGYTSVPQPALGGRRTFEPRGRLPGGSSDFYLMMHVRGHPSDYDEWARQGAAGWSYEQVRPWFRRAEGAREPVGDLGTDGPQPITDAARHEPNPTSATFLAACAELGHPPAADFNGSDLAGAGWHQLDIVDGVRQGALTSYLQPALARPNLTLWTSAVATGLILAGGRCAGVRYEQDAEPDPDELPGDVARRVGAPGPGRGPREVLARREVLLAAGSIESPKLLLLSGIGSADELRELDIPVRAALPGVGRNFHNHVLTGVIHELTGPVPQARQNVSESVLFARSERGLATPDLQLAYVHVPFDLALAPEHPNAVSILPGLVRPVSRGSVRLADADPRTPPLVDPNYLADGWDLDRLVQALRLARDVFGTKAFGALAKEELSPGAGVRTTSELADFVRHSAESYHHQVGSCRMGRDDLSVVDPDLRVHGVDGLRVVDASVMPSVPSGNCHAAVLMIAERAAAFVRGTDGA